MDDDRGYVYVGDVFLLNYYGIYIFLCTCKRPKDGEDTFYIFELGTKKYKDGIMLKKGFLSSPSKNPFIVLENNCWSKSTYEVTAIKDCPGANGIDYYLPIEIKYNSKIFLEAKRRGIKNPTFGTFYAYFLRKEQYQNKYFINCLLEPKKPGKYRKIEA